MIIINDHLKSPRCFGEWNDAYTLKYIILHDIKFPLHETKQIFEQLEVSSHYYVDTSGVIHELIPLENKAFHAGLSKFFDDEALNNTSIGIESEGTWDNPANEDQALSIFNLVQSLKAKFPSIKKILSHAEISPYRIKDDAIIPGKIDPGINFPWKKLAELGIEIYHDIDIKPDPKVLLSFGNNSSAISLIQKSLYDYGYTLIPTDGVYDIRTAAVLNAFYLRYYPQWFYINQNAIKNILIETTINKFDRESYTNNPDITLNELSLEYLSTNNITDQWIFNTLDYLPISNVDENAVLIMEEILGLDIVFV